MTALEWPDFVVIAVYFVGILGVGVLSAMRSKRDTVGGFFLARRTMHWIPVGASIFASNIGSEHFVGLAGSGASTGITVAAFELNAMFILLILGWIFLPVYMASGVYTVPDYIKRRFGGERIETLLSILALIQYIFTKISADLYAGTLFIRACFGLTIYPSIVALLLLAAIFTIVGGQSAVIWTDLLQTVLMIGGALTVSILGFVHVGGYDKLMHDFYYKQPNDSVVAYDRNNESCSQVGKGYSHLLRPATDMDLPWTGATFGITILALWYWCCDQVIVQRGLAARNMSHAKGGCVVAGYLKFLPLWLVVFPGMVARVLFTDTIACSKPEACEAACGQASGCSNHAFPLLVVNLLPKGLRGLMLSVTLATLMCSLSAVFNSSSTIFTVNIWSRIRKKASQLELLLVGRVFVLLMLGVAIVWIPIMSSSQNSHLFDYLQSISTCLAPPVCGVFIVSILSERITEQGAFWAMLIGLGVGICRFGLEFGYSVPACGSDQVDTRPVILSAIHYLHFGMILFGIVIVIAIVISLLTEPRDPKKLVRLTFWTRHSLDVRALDVVPDKKIDNRTSVSGHNNAAFSEFPRPTEIIPLENVNDNGDTRQHRIPRPLGSRPRNSLFRRIVERILGLPSSSDLESKPVTKITPEEEVLEAMEVLSEDPRWKLVADINGVVLLVAAVFIWGYFG